MSAVSIRRAGAADLEAFRRLSSMLFESDAGLDPSFNRDWVSQDAGREYFDNAVEFGVCLLAETADSAVGLLDGGIIHNAATTVLRAQISQLYVIPQMRRQGVAGRLVHAYLDWCDRNEVDEFVVTVVSDNREALAFYDSLGVTVRRVRVHGNVRVARDRVAQRWPSNSKQDFPTDA